jgi:hypothetical protein
VEFMTTFDNGQYKAILDEPNESLAVEYKEWLDLSRPEVRANLARHIAALANFGGGTIVLGITDAMHFAGNNPFPNPPCNRDVIASIVKKHLDPPFQCDVRQVVSSLGNTHPIVIVPPHGATPICAKANGPADGNKTIGIIQGTYYTRKPGPESARLETPAEWAPIMRRCAMHDRAAILGALDAALRGSGPPPSSVADALKSWHDAANKEFLKDAGPLNTPQSYWQVSYAVERDNKQMLRQENLVEILRQVYAEVQDTVRSGWNMLDPQGSGSLRPYFLNDPTSGQGDEDFLELSTLKDEQGSILTYLWRVSADGKATSIRQYWEDLPQQQVPPAGTWTSPNWMVRSLAEIVRHARGMTERFDNPTAVSFRCEWHGLLDRELYSPNTMWSLANSKSRVDHKTATGSYPVTMLTNRWPEVVAELVAPLMRSFSADQVVSSDWIRGHAPNWLMGR